MKKLSISLLLVAALAVNTFAADKTSKDKDGSNATATTNATTATYFVSNQFAGTFANAKDVTWTVTKQVQKAEFILNGKKMTAFYGVDGEYMGVAQVVNFSMVPIEAQAEIAKRYADYKIGEVIEYETPADDAALRLLNGNNDTPIKFFVDLKNDKEEFLLKVNRVGSVSYFKQIK